MRINTTTALMACVFALLIVASGRVINANRDLNPTSTIPEATCVVCSNWTSLPFTDSSPLPVIDSGIGFWSGFTFTDQH
ncbi:MAG: hypothetical protein ABFD54_01230 [Armatimonadota bacterium]|nr:hypothetical protein [bacterium]